MAERSQARRGRSRAKPGDRDRAPEAAPPTREEEGKTETAATAPPTPTSLTCSVTFCPICLAVTTVGAVRPDVVEHLVLAAREFLLAVRAVIDGRLETEETEQPERLHRIRIE